MCKNLYLPGTTISSWPGVVVLLNDGNGNFHRTNWPWSTTYHEHYEVASFAGGSYWVPASTSPPNWWPHPVRIEGDRPVTSHGVNPSGREFRPSGVYIWIPRIPNEYTPGVSYNRVVCSPPASAPRLQAEAPVAQLATSVPSAGGLEAAHQRLDALLAQPIVLAADAATNAFQDSDGLISFVNLSSDLVTNKDEFKTGIAVFDKIANFFATLRIKVYTAMKSGAVAPLQGDTAPTSQWDPAVTHYMEFLLQETGGLTDYSITQETYSDTQYLAEFSTSFIKLLFDAVTVPTSIVSGVTSFISGVGNSLRASWDNRERTYQVALLGQCHEAVQENATGDPVYRYFPKLKYYHLTVTATQSEFTTSCSTVRKITFSFAYEYYITAVAAAVLDKTSADYTKFTGFLNKAQAANYKDAENKLDAILGGTVSSGPGALSTFNVELGAYPEVHAAPIKRLVPA
jgi:hypothetical protein